MYKAALEKNGYVVTVVNDGPSGVAHIYQNLPDLVVADLMMPGLNGYQICRLIKNDPVTKKIPVLLVSNSNADFKMDKFWGIKAGADMILSEDELRVKLAKQAESLLNMYGRVDVAERQKYLDKTVGQHFSVDTRLNQILDRALIESTLMIEFRNLSDLVYDTGLLNYMLFSLIEGVLEYDAAAIFYNDRNKDPRVVSFHAPEGSTLAQKQLSQLKDAFFGTIRQDSGELNQYESFEFEIVGESSEDAEPVEYATCFIKPFISDGQLIGGVAFYSKAKVDFEKIFPVSLVLSEMGHMMSLRNIYSRAEVLSITDALTGLFNYKHFRRMLDQEFKTSRRYEQAVSVALIEIDHFKQLNDRLGHETGDEIIKVVAEQAEKSFRGVDIIARYTGKQLVIVFPKTTKEAAQGAMDRFQAEVAKTPFVADGESVSLSVSQGLVELSPEMTAASDLIHEAEVLLKKSGVAKH